MQLPSPEPFQIQAAGNRRMKDASRVGFHTHLARPEGFEPPAFRIGICCDIQLRYGRMKTVSNYSTPMDKFQSLVSQNRLIFHTFSSAKQKGRGEKRGIGNFAAFPPQPFIKMGLRKMKKKRDKQVI